MITIDDFVMLGKTVPEPTRTDGRIFVCSAGISASLRSLVRIYPLARHGAPKRWTVNKVALEVNPKDHRKESFKLAGDRAPGVHERINNTFVTTGEIPTPRRASLLKPYTVASIREVNASKASLALLHPLSVELYFEHNPESPDSPQLSLFDAKETPEAGAKRFAYIPRLRFKDEDGEHKLMLRDWGCFELMRKQPGFETWSESKRRDFMAGALHLDDSCSLLVGNFNQHRNSWLVISVLRGLREPAALFDELPEAS